MDSVDIGGGPVGPGVNAAILAPKAEFWVRVAVSSPRLTLISPRIALVSLRIIVCHPLFIIGHLDSKKRVYWQERMLTR